MPYFWYRGSSAPLSRVEFGLGSHPQNKEMTKVTCWIFLCWMCVSAMVFFPAYGVASDSTICRQLAADIEAYLNKQQIPINGNRRVKVVLCFDAQQRFAPTESNPYEDEDYPIIQALSEYDRHTGKLSGNPILADTNYTSSLTFFMDKELERFWFTKIEKTGKGQEPDAIFNSYEIMPTPQGGMKVFLDSVTRQLKMHRDAASFFKKDTLIVSFIVGVADRNVPQEVRVNEAKDPGMRRIVANSGVWQPGVYCGLPISAYVEVEFYRTLLDTKKKELKYADGRHMHFIMFPEMVNAEYMQIFPDHFPRHTASDALIVSFILNDHQPVMHGEVILRGSRKEGRKLLNRIRRQLKDSPLIRSFQPSRFYVSFPAKRKVSFPKISIPKILYNYLSICGVCFFAEVCLFLPNG